MLIDFKSLEEIKTEHMNGGNGVVYYQIYMDTLGKISRFRIPPNCSIGMHKHIISDEIDYIISGTGIAVIDGANEALYPGMCHYCPLGLEHSIINTGNEELIFQSLVPTLITK